MATATFTKVYSLTEAIAKKVHNLGSDTLKVALCAAANAPTTATTQYSGLTVASLTNLSGATPANVTITSCVQTTGVLKLILADLTLTATGSVGPFRYVVLYNDTATNKEVIGWMDYGADVTMSASETFLIDFDGANGVFTIG